MVDSSFSERIGGSLRTRHPNCLQVNLGKLCNQACLHCHVDAGPKRTEIMSLKTIHEVLAAVEFLGVHTVDVTGGAPEMNPDFRFFIKALRERGVVRIIDRCNLTILLEPGFEWAAEFLAENEVEIVASLPFYMEENVDRQRGKGVFKKSIEAMRQLNRLGYGQDLPFHLVYNPQGAYLPPEQAELEVLYKRYMSEHFGVSFNQLFTITNMPIARFAHFLQRSGNYQRYMNKLRSRYNPETLDSVMCRDLISVGWDGRLYDCDFNQMLDMTLESDGGTHIRDIEQILLKGREIRVGDHCYGCTAGGGSSCGGSLEKKDQVVSVAV